MVEMNDAAREQLDGYFADKDKAPIRVFLAGGCGGPRLSLALDEPRENDQSFELSGYTVLVEKALLEVTGKISIQMTEYGFAVESEKELPGGGGGCGGGCGGGSGASSGCGCGGSC